MVSQLLMSTRSVAGLYSEGVANVATAMELAPDPGSIVFLFALVATVAAMLLFALRCCRSPHAPAGQSLAELRAFTQWARQHIEASPPEAHRQVLDDVIYAFASYAQRLDSASDGGGGEACQAAVARLRVLGELLDTPSICSALRAANWSWLRAWEQNQLSHEEMRIRCSALLPTVMAAAWVRPSAASRAPLPPSKDQDALCGGEQGPGPRRRDFGLDYVANWCADFLERPDVKALLRDGATPLSPGRVGLQGEECFSDSEDSEDERAAADASGQKDDSGAAAVPHWLPREEYAGQAHTWTDPDATIMRVRGLSYAEDRVKVKSASSMLELVCVDLLKSEEVVHYAANPHCAVPYLRQNGESRFFFILNFRLPPVHFAAVWAVPRNAGWEGSKEGRLFRRFCGMTKDERNKRFKVLPRVAEGPWLAKQALPEKPALIGRKLAMEYFQDDTYLEVSVNCLSSPAARHIASVLQGAARAFAVQVFVLLEGQSAEELPERILGGMQASFCDLPAIGVRKT